MALIRALALGAVAAISLPYVLRDESGALAQVAGYGTVRPVPGAFGLHFSVPIFLVVAGLGWALLKAAER